LADTRQLGLSRHDTSKLCHNHLSRPIVNPPSCVVVPRHSVGTGSPRSNQISSHLVDRIPAQCRSGSGCGSRRPKSPDAFPNFYNTQPKNSRYRLRGANVGDLLWSAMHGCETASRDHGALEKRRDSKFPRTTAVAATRLPPWSPASATVSSVRHSKFFQVIPSRIAAHDLYLTLTRNGLTKLKRFDTNASPILGIRAVASYARQSRARVSALPKRPRRLL
jgi:hypothetical protein